MASLPAVQTENTDAQQMQDAIYRRLAAGESPSAIARKMYPHDHLKRRRLRQRIHRLAKRDEFRVGAVENMQTDLWLASPSIMQGLIRRAQRGRVDAAKLLFEMMGLHNPKVKHEHSGDVAIKVTFDRPPAVETEAHEITDAEVVED